MKEKIENHKSLGNKMAGSLSAIMNFKYLKRLFGLFRIEYKSHGWYILLLGFLSFFGGILEGFGVTAIIPLFSFIDKEKVDSTDLISQFIEKFFAFFHLPYTLKFLLVFILALFLVKAVILFISSHISAYITTAYEKKTRSELLALTLKSDWKYLSKQKIGYLNQLLNIDVATSSVMLMYLSMFLITITNLIVYSFLAFNVSPTIAILTVLFGIVIFFIFKPLLYKNKVASQKLAQLNKDSAHYVDEAIIGMKAIKSMFLEKSIIQFGCKYFDQKRKLSMKMAVLANLTGALLQPLGIVLIVGIFAYFYKTAAFSFASFAVIVYAINKVFSNVQTAQGQLNRVSTFEPYLSAIVKYKEESIKQEEKDHGSKDFSFKDQFKFKDVSFSYNNDKEVLSNIDFSVKNGEMVGIIGPSGSGKTTITDLILRLFKPDKGEILIDGEPIDNIKLSEWRTKIGYVSQDAFLINDTVANNIKFYNESVSQADVERAAKLANIYEFINQLPERFDTVVGERGVRLSGGQRQRIVLARVLAINPQILILDEATSSLDSESEGLIKKAIDNFRGKVTMIVIAHRISTVMNADKLIVIENRKITEQGLPDELLKDKNSYLFKISNLT